MPTIYSVGKATERNLNFRFEASVPAEPHSVERGRLARCSKRTEVTLDDAELLQAVLGDPGVNLKRSLKPSLFPKEPPS